MKKNYQFGAIAAVVFVAIVMTFAILGNASSNVPQSVTAAESTANMSGSTTTTNTIDNDASSGSDNNTTGTAQSPPTNTSTPNLSVYIVPVKSGADAAETIRELQSFVFEFEAFHSTELGASPQGQYGYENATITSQNATEGFEEGQMVEKRVLKRPADTVTIHIDPEVKKPDGKPVTLADIREDWQFGNGITCCGIELKDETTVSAAWFVVDQAYDPQVRAVLEDIKAAVS